VRVYRAVLRRTGFDDPHRRQRVHLHLRDHGELIAWIIGGTVILEYAVSNMAVSVGFSAHLVDLFDWFGWHPGLRWISPAYLPSGLTGLKGDMLYAPGLHFGFNLPAFPGGDDPDRDPGARHSRVSRGRPNNTMRDSSKSLRSSPSSSRVRITFIPKTGTPFAPNGFSGILTGGSIIFFTYIGFDSVSTAAEEAKNPQRDLTDRDSSRRW